jgi:ATP:cob(I)alamin adenosyltransferase
VPEGKFQEPRLALNRIYTRRGDQGQTTLVGGQRAPKNALRIECYGTVDELNSFIGLAAVTAAEESRLETLSTILRRVQHELFNLGSILATLPEDVGPQQPCVTAIEVEQLEREIDAANAELKPLRSFVLPGGFAPECRASHLPHRMPQSGAASCCPGSSRKRTRRSDPIPEPPQRCAVRMEPLGKPHARRGGSVMVPERGRVG